MPYLVASCSYYGDISFRCCNQPAVANLPPHVWHINSVQSFIAAINTGTTDRPPNRQCHCPSASLPLYPILPMRNNRNNGPLSCQVDIWNTHRLPVSSCDSFLTNFRTLVPFREIRNAFQFAGFLSGYPK